MRYTGPPALVSDLTRLGVVQADAWCPRCHRQGILSLDRFDGATPFVAIKRRMKCSGCGGREVDLTPDWRGYQAAGRM